MKGMPEGMKKGRYAVIFEILLPVFTNSRLTCIAVQTNRLLSHIQSVNPFTNQIPIFFLMFIIHK